jgi:hypothetical protein
VLATGGGEGAPDALSEVVGDAELPLDGRYASRRDTDQLSEFRLRETGSGSLGPDIATAPALPIHAAIVCRNRMEI